MSEHHPHGATTIRASKSGGAGKWLLGGLAAVVLAGGGYLAWKVYGAGDPNQRGAFEASYAPEHAGPLEPLDNGADESATYADERAEPTASAPHAAAPARRTTTARAEAVPEQTIGITPVNATTEDTLDGEEVVVTAPMRPVWTRTPSERRLTTLYPARAQALGREGEARLQCTVVEGGALDCMRVEETSRTFGAAAVRVARTLRHAPQRADGSNAIGTPVNLRIVFRLEDEHGQRFAAR